MNEPNNPMGPVDPEPEAEPEPTPEPEVEPSHPGADDGEEANGEPGDAEPAA